MVGALAKALLGALDARVAPTKAGPGEEPMLDVEQAIREVGTVYQALTGRPIEEGRSSLSPEMDAPARADIEDRYRQFKTIIASPFAEPAQAAPAWVPGVTVIEHDLEVRYEIDLPAVGREHVGVSVLGGFLVVRGVRRPPMPEAGPSNGAAGAAVRYTERPSGAFQRVIALPARARRDGITASLREGVLSVNVPTDGPGGAAVAVEIR
jgi:HSP20 family molecular chaperone IbpA